MGRFCDQCMPGYFLDPALIQAAEQFGLSPRDYVDSTPANVSCVPCMCNGHANTCNADTGEGCPCVDYTYTRSSDCQPALGSCYSAQCTACLPTVSVGTSQLQQDGSPLDGQLCYMVPSVGMSLDQSIEAGEIQPYLVIPRYTNVDIRVYLDIDIASAALLNVYVTLHSNVTKDSYNMLVFNEPVLDSVAARGRVVLTISSNDHNFDQDHFYIIVSNSAASSASVHYRIAFLQPFVNIDLFVFFSVFFSSFFLFLAVVALGFKIRSHFEERMIQHQAEIQMEVSAERICGIC